MPDKWDTVEMYLDAIASMIENRNRDPKHRTGTLVCLVEMIRSDLNQVEELLEKTKEM